MKSALHGGHKKPEITGKSRQDEEMARYFDGLVKRAEQACDQLLACYGIHPRRR